MKNKIGLVMIALLMANFTFGQKVKEQAVPAIVKETFKKQYPTAKEVKWEKEAGNFEVSFDLNETDNSVLYDVTGKVLETEIEIETVQLPQDAIAYINKNYNGTKIKEASKITNADGTVNYEAEIKGKDLIFDSLGKFIKASKD